MHEEKIIAFLKDNIAVTNADVRNITGLSSAAARKVLNRMVTEELLISIGMKKNRKYQLMQK